jgi:hypothetical protein
MPFDHSSGIPNNLFMHDFLESQIGLLERGAPSPDLRELEDLIAFHLTALERLESHLGPGGLSERTVRWSRCSNAG